MSAQLGLAFVPRQDAARLGRQQRAVVDLMQDGRWRTLSEIAAAVGAHELALRLLDWAGKRAFLRVKP